MQEKAVKSEDCRTIIQGMKEDGEKFRPSDWMERISSQIAQYGEAGKSLRYRDCARPRIINGEKCLVIEHRLAEKDQEAYRFVKGFAESHQLQIREECEEIA